MTRLRISSPADFVSGLMFAGVGIGAVWIAADYPIGTLRHMGPGMMPLGLGTLLLVVGLALTAQSIAMPRKEASDVSLPGIGAFRAAFFVLLGLFVFSLMIRPMGLALSTVALVLISSRAERGYSILGASVLSAALAAIAVGIFVYGLGLPFRVWPRF